MCLLHRRCQRFSFVRHNHEMNVIGHKAVADDGNGKKLNSLPQQIEIDHSVCVSVQKELPRIAALSNVMRNTLCNYTGQTCHRRTKISENVPSVPGFPAISVESENGSPEDYYAETGRFTLTQSSWTVFPTSFSP
jgi:hypothetical protein